MTDEQAPGFGFRIRPLPPRGATQPEPARPAVPPPEPPPEPAETTPHDAPPITPEASDHTGARFNAAQSALDFLGAVAGAGLAESARALRGPEGRWWVEVPAPWTRAAALAANATGQPFAGGGLHWRAVPADGSAPPAPARRAKAKGDAILLQNAEGEEQLPLAEWREAGLADLLLAARLRPAHPRRLDRVMVAAPGVVARTILRRALSLGFSVEVSAAEREPLAGGPCAGVSWLHIHWRQPRVPEAFLHAIMQLPYVAVVRPAGLAPGEEPAQARLLVDIRHTAPLSSALVAALVPAGERWLLGGPEVGHWRVRLLGRPADGAELIQLPPTPDAAQATPPLDTGDHRAPIPLRLVQRAPLPGHPDAVLLDDAELAWLRDYLVGKPAAETAYLVPGPGRHLLLAPGGLLSTLPFGITLRRIGPGGFHLQEGRALYPPLPEPARGRAFPCGEGELVAVTCGGQGCDLEAHRFQLDRLTPVWALWLGEPPAVSEGVRGDLAQRVQALASALEPKEPSFLRRQAAKVIPALRPRAPTDRDQLLREALALEQQGRFAEAAQRLERAGEWVAAGRLYERAAG